MYLIIPLIYFLLFNGTLTVVFKKKFGECLPLTLVITTLIMFISQLLFKTFNVGFYLNIFVAVLFPILLGYFKFIAKKKLELKENYFTKGFFIFVLLYLFVMILDFNRTFSQWDELSHWGVMVKEMFRLDKFYSVDASTLMVHKDYPPFASLFELFWCKLTNTYSESGLISSIHLFEFSLFIPAIAENKIKGNKLNFIIKGILGIALMYLLLTVLDTANILNTIYIDIFMMILFAYSFYLVISAKEPTSNFNIFKLVLALVSLVLTKQMGLPLFLLVAFYYILDMLIRNKFKIKFDKKKLLNLLKIALVIILPLVFYKIWGLYIDSLNITGQFEMSSINLSSIKNILTDTEGYRYITLSNFIYSIMNGIIIWGPINLTYFSAAAFILILIIIINYLYKDKFNKEKALGVGLSLGLGTIGYMMAMLLLYLFCFSSDEALVLASYGRYMATFILGEISILTMIFINIETNKEKNIFSYKNILLIFAVSMLFISGNKYMNFVPPFVRGKNTYYADYEEKANYLMSKVPNDAKVYMITSKFDYTYFVKYYANPITTNIENGQPFYLPQTKEIMNNGLTEFINHLKKYEYIYILDYDDDFISNYSFLFESIDDIKIDQVYKIEIKDNNMKFKKI